MDLAENRQQLQAVLNTMKFVHYVIISFSRKTSVHDVS
jgi:hypothetical protein